MRANLVRRPVLAMTLTLALLTAPAAGWASPQHAGTGLGQRSMGCVGRVLDAAAGRCGRQFVDDDGDGVCDNRALAADGTQGAGQGARQGNGQASVTGNGQAGRSFVDDDGDGVCDNRGTGASRGQGNGGHGAGAGQGSSTTAGHHGRRS